jgi:hypothetical protein
MNCLRKINVRVLVLLVFIPLTMLVLQALTYVAVGILCGGDSLHKGLITFISYLLCAITFVAIYQKQKSAEENTPLRFFNGISIFFCSMPLLIGFLFQLSISGLLALLDFANPQILESYRSMIERSFTKTGSLLTVFTVIFISPLAEEVAFRLVGGNIASRISRGFAVVSTAFLFGIYHGNPVQFIYAFAAGLLFADMDWCAGAILPSVIAHVAVNLTAYLPIEFLYATPLGAAATTIISALLFAVSYMMFRKRVSRKYFADKSPKTIPDADNRD